MFLGPTQLVHVSKHALQTLSTVLAYFPSGHEVPQDEPFNKYPLLQVKHLSYESQVLHDSGHL